jgi:hypothetical protein
MSIGERIIHEIDRLPDEEKKKVLEKIKEKFFQLPKNAFVVRENYDFWLNEKDDEYDKL